MLAAHNNVRSKRCRKISVETGDMITLFYIHFLIILFDSFKVNLTMLSLASNDGMIKEYKLEMMEAVLDLLFITIS